MKMTAKTLIGALALTIFWGFPVQGHYPEDPNETEPSKRTLAVDTRAMKAALERLLKHLEKHEKKLASEGASFYQGKTLRLVSVYRPGGANDTQARLLARHIGRHIPGNPRILVLNRPGSGGVRGTSYVYNETKPDGLTIVQTVGHAAQSQFLNAGIDPSSAFDMTKFNWLGVTKGGGPVVVAVHRESPIQDLRTWLYSSKRPLIIGCTWPGGINCRISQAIKNVFGKTEIVAGFRTRAQLLNALRRRDVDAIVWTDSERARYRSMIADGDAKVIAYVHTGRHPGLENVPLLNDYVSTSTDLALLNLFTLPTTMRHAWAAPPNTPQDRVEVLRSAFEATLRDPAFLAEAALMGTAVNPTDAEWLSDFTAKIKRQMTQEVITRGREIARTTPRTKVREHQGKPRMPAPPSLHWNDPCNLKRHRPLEHRPFVSRPCV